KLELELTDLDVRQTITEVIELFAASASRKGLKLSAHIHDNVPTALRGDPVRLRQILTNLIGNAVKFTHRGEITIEVRCLDSKFPSQGSSLTPQAASLLTLDHRLLIPTFWLLHFAVRDTGIGIAPKARKHVFEAFSQEDDSTTRKYGGTGLGLSIAKQITPLIGGEIGGEKAPGKRSNLLFTPRLAPPPPAHPEARGPPTPPPPPPPPRA